MVIEKLNKFSVQYTGAVGYTLVLVELDAVEPGHFDHGGVLHLLQSSRIAVAA